MSTAEEIVGAIDAGFVAERETEPNRFPISGSQVAKCPRQLGTMLTDETRMPEDGKRLRNFMHGDVIEDNIVQALVASMVDPGVDPKVETQVEVWTPLPIANAVAAEAIIERAAAHPDYAGELRLTGDGTSIEVRSRIDIVLTGPNWLCMIEVKSVPGFKAKWVKDGKVDEGYLAQAAVQRIGLARKHGRPVDLCLLLHQAKDSGELIPYEVPAEWDPSVELGSVTRVLEAWVHGQVSGLPALFASKDSRLKSGRLPWQCNYCAVGPIVANCCPDELIRVGESNGVPFYEVS